MDYELKDKLNKKLTLYCEHEQNLIQQKYMEIVKIKENNKSLSQ